MNKAERMKKWDRANQVRKGCLRGCLLSVVGMILLLIIAFASLLYYTEWSKTKLYTDITYNGDELVVYEIGHNLLTNYHLIVVEVNGVQLLQCGVLANETISLYPKESIICANDNENVYEIIFNECETNETQIKFSADFSKLIYVKGWDFKQLDNSFEIIEDDTYMYDPF